MAKKSKPKSHSAKAAPEDHHKKKHEAYVLLIKEVFGKHGLESFQQPFNTLPSSPVQHFIVKKQKENYLGIVPCDICLAVAEIVVEPSFSEFNNQKGEPPAMRLHRLEYETAIKEFAEAFQKHFNEEWKLLQH